MKYALIAIAASAPFALAQSPVWGQCGGNGWTGAKTCAAGSTCVYSNDWYSQCIPGSNNPTTTRTTTTTRGTTSPSRSPTTTPSPSRTTSTTVIRTTTTTQAGVSTTTTTGGVVVTTTTTRGGTPTSAGGAVTVTGNPFLGVQLFANPYYASEINTLAMPSLSPALQAKASAVAKVPTFAWLDTRSKIPLMESHLVAIRAANKAGANPPIAGTFIVYDLPDRDCAAAASNGEYSSANGGMALYKSYIDAIRALVVEYSDVRIILIIEPDSLANMVTNLSVPKCQIAEPIYIEGTDYALEKLNLPNVAMYLDGGHGGWLGWPANLEKAVTLYTKIYANAGKPSQLRGFATNVSNYNGWSLATCPRYTSPNPNCDEKKYINAFGPALAAAGFPAHFIIDTGRNGVQPTAQIEQGNWCNVIGTGFGTRPTTNTGDALADAFVWAKPGGESDGTSNTSAVRYDFHCGSPDALKPAPEAGSWFQAYFEQLLTNANPVL